MVGEYSGAAQQEAWFGKHLKIGFAAQDWLPDDEDYNLWYEGSITNWNLGGGAKEVEGVKCMGGITKQYQKPQEDYELSLDVIQTDTMFDEMLIGDSGFYADLFDSHADDAAIQTDWTEGGDGANPELDTTYFKSGKQSGKFTATDSTHTATWELDLSTHLGSTQDIEGFAGTDAANADRGRAEMVVYIPDATTLAGITTISLTIGSDGSHFSKYDYTVSGNCVIGWNKIIFDLTTADSSTGTTDWGALDKVKITLVIDDNVVLYVDRIRIFDPVISTAMIPDKWRAVFLYETNASAAVGEKRRMVCKNCIISSFEPASDASEHLTASITLKLPALDASGNGNLKIEHTPDASEAALTTLSSY